MFLVPHREGLYFSFIALRLQLLRIAKVLLLPLKYFSNSTLDTSVVTVTSVPSNE